MRQSRRWLLIWAAGLLLLFGPTSLRSLQPEPGPAYTPPAIATAALAATPVPTVTAAPLAAQPVEPAVAMARPGPVVVDLAHYSDLERDRFHALAGSLAARGIDLRFWLPTVPLDSVPSFAAFPDQSAELHKILADASALVVVSPFFLYNRQEIQVVERFLTDGGRLLLISDPDIESDAARDTNSLALPFDIVFQEDYLYDVADNDANYTHFFQGSYLDQAAELAGSRIGFYGGRSIEGAVIPQVRSAPSTLSSLRTGQTAFTTVALGGRPGSRTAGRVLALSDFDVLTDPYVARHDNRRMLDFVAAFLAGGKRSQTIVDFPEFLGPQVALVVVSDEAAGAPSIRQAAALQLLLERSGRTLQLGVTRWLTDSLAAPNADLLVVARYQEVDKRSLLLADAGFVLQQGPAPLPGSTPSPPTATPQRAAPTPPTPAAFPAKPLPATTDPPRFSTSQTGRMAVGQPATHAPLAEPLPTEPAAPPEVAPAAPPDPTLYLVQKDGIQLLASETLLFLQRSETDGRRLLALLAASEVSLQTGLQRLLDQDFSNCLVQDELAICPVDPAAAVQPPAPPSAPTPAPTSAVPAAPPEASAAAPILVVDDNLNASAEESSEAVLYAELLAAAGYTADVWATRTDGLPSVEELTRHSWVIWSDAAYAQSGIQGESLRLLSELINAGGKVTIGSRMPFFGVGGEAASPIVDLQVAEGLPALVAGLPTEPIKLPDGLPAVVPLERSPDVSTGASIALRRGPVSLAADAPAVMLYTDENFEAPKGARLLLVGLALTWLPSEISARLVQNMAAVMLAYRENPSE
ncbi:MAG: hypothetical protein ACOYL7_05760 [Caldilinea sp.]